MENLLTGLKIALIGMTATFLVLFLLQMCIALLGRIYIPDFIRRIILPQPGNQAERAARAERAEQQTAAKAKAKAPQTGDEELAAIIGVLAAMEGHQSERRIRVEKIPG
ncbi:MAG TPA: hypothetical protein GXX29_04270 [Firmicutes bacterium]|nr:hypothetical protein [Bacillota bacterium]